MGLFNHNYHTFDLYDDWYYYHYTNTNTPKYSRKNLLKFFKDKHLNFDSKTDLDPVILLEIRIWCKKYLENDCFISGQLQVFQSSNDRIMFILRWV